MAYKLKITKYKFYKKFRWNLDFTFAILDGENYPKNYVANLPRSYFQILKSKGFGIKFKNFNRVEFALELLNNALINPEYANDEEIKAELEARKKLIIKYQSPVMPKLCRGCGQIFTPKRRGKYCSTCQQNYSAQVEVKISKGYRPKPKLGFVAKSVREALLNE